MQKEFKNGLCLMKAYPPHLGHIFLIDTAHSQCETVHVMVCSLKNELIDGKLRYGWLRDYYKNNPNINVIHCEDENPQHPSECTSVDEFYNSYWCPSVYQHIDKLDAVFTSEDYGDEFASYLNVKHVLVDKERKHYPVSGTAVRHNPFNVWNFIPKDVKKYFMKKIAVMGPESVGKSTMVKLLSEHYNVPYIDEFGRSYVELTGTDDLRAFDFESIAHHHNRRINNLISLTPKVVLVDTEAITTKVFGKMYVDGLKSDFIDGVIKNQIFDLYLVFNCDVPWIDDGTRDFPEGRNEHLSAIIAEIEALGRNYVVIDGKDYNERFNKCIEEIDNLGYL
jgi:HTH-type transcriptional repressor of NAD biosynthesis genes